MNWIKKLFTKKITTQEEFMDMFKKKILSGNLGKGKYSSEVLTDVRIDSINKLLNSEGYKTKNIIL